MRVIKDISEVQNTIQRLRQQGKRIGFVPTMGALHEGHLSLVDIAKHHADIVVVSIFVNKAQFAPHEDFDSYPRTEEDDIKKLVARKVEIAYLPLHKDMYPNGVPDKKVPVGDIGRQLEGEARPHFFEGVVLVVSKLFEQVTPHIAVFGEKDYQQFIVIKQLVDTQNIPVEIIGVPICREKDGLAMSSRNVYLNQKQRKIAPYLYKTLCLVREKIKQGTDIKTVLEWGKQALVQQGFDKVDYLELRQSETLMPLDHVSIHARLLVVARLGEVRLLDNIEI